MTLLPTLKQRPGSDCLVDLAGCDLAGISDEGDSIRIGAMTRHVDVAVAVVQKRSLRWHIWPANGGWQVRNRGTMVVPLPIMTRQPVTRRQYWPWAALSAKPVNRR